MLWVEKYGLLGYNYVHSTPANKKEQKMDMINFVVVTTNKGLLQEHNTTHSYKSLGILSLPYLPRRGDFVMLKEESGEDEIKRIVHRKGLPTLLVV